MKLRFMGSCSAEILPGSVFIFISQRGAWGLGLGMDEDEDEEKDEEA